MPSQVDQGCIRLNWGTTIEIHIIDAQNLHYLKYKAFCFDRTSSCLCQTLCDPCRASWPVQIIVSKLTCSVHSVDRTNLPNRILDALKKRIQGSKSQNSTRLTVSLSLFQETFLTSTFQSSDFTTELRYDPTPYEAETFRTDGPVTREDDIKVSSVSKRYSTRK